MRRLINSTTILSLALYIVPPFAAQAQDFPKVTIDGKEVICLPDKMAVCPDGALCVVVKNKKNCEAKATEVYGKAATTGGTTTAPDATASGTTATDQTAADKAAADKAAADQAAADKAAADKAAADKAAADQTAADKAAADKAAADKAAADQAAADKAVADKAAADQAAADKAAADQAAADQTAADQAAADKAAKKAARAADVAKTQSDTTTAAAAAANLPTVTAGGKVFICLPDKATACPDGAACVVAKNPAKCQEKADAKVASSGDTATPVPAPAEDAAAVAAAQKAAADAAAAAAANPNAVTVEAPVPSAEAVTKLETALDAPVASDGTVKDTPVAAVIPEPAAGTLPADQPTPKDATVTTEVVKPEDTRSSSQEFKAAPATVSSGKKTGLSDFEKVGLIALGALAIGAILNGNRQVVQNTGDRVVVRQPDGTYQIYKDDNALLREPGSTVRTETFNDGSTRTIVTRVDKSQIVTIRDASGRVLQRVAYDRTGHPTVLIDDLQPEVAVDVTTLPRVPRKQISISDTNVDLQTQVATSGAQDVGRLFSLRQIRTITEVRYLAATIDVNNITFATGSAAIADTEARKLDRLGKLMTRMIATNPNEVFLIEGHTDAVGSAASNLSLSDRRAESVAKALTEFFNVPPENLVVQGYGESELKIDSQGDERANRRVAVRIITPLLRQTAMN